MPRGRPLGRLEDDRVAGSERRSELPCSHQDRKVPGDDLADDAEGFVVVIGDRGLVDLGDRAFLGTDASGEVTEVIDSQGEIGGHSLADRFAVVPCLNGGEHLEVVFHPRCNLFEQASTFSL